MTKCVDIDLIQATAKITANETVMLLKTENMIKGKRNAFQKTELLLYNYPKFKEIIADKDRQIREIKAEGLPQKSKSITSWGGATNQEPKSDMEKAEDRIVDIEKSIVVTRRLIKIIDEALRQIAGDSYYGVIQMFYFEGLNREEIADAFGCDVSTVGRNKKKLVDSIKLTLFSGDAIAEIFYS
ncbi:MAG: hypothetical protein RSB52_08535 [Acidaminococcaceae bacterium]